MRYGFTNLLPKSRRRAVVRDYLMRVAVVAIVLFIIVVGISAILLTPTYLFLAGSASAKTASLSSSKSVRALTEERAFTTQLAALSSDTSRIMATAKRVSPTKMISTILSVSRTGVTLLGFSYQAQKGTKSGQLNITGTAATRADLRSYQLALEKLSFVKSADLPVSAYAASAKIPFSISLTLTP